MRRLWAMSLVLLWTAAPVLGTWHVAAVRHVWCAEHGVLEERDGDPGATDAPGARGATVPHHEACGFARPTPPSRAPARVAPAAAAPALPPPPRAPAAHAVAPPIALLAVAPKGSPPPAAV